MNKTVELLNKIGAQTYDYLEHITLLESHLLEEGTFDIDNDVDLLMDRLGVNTVLESYKNDPSKLHSLYWKSQGMTLSSVESDILTDSISIAAHDKIPVSIHLKLGGGSHYNPSEGEILISFNGSAIEYLGDEGLNNVQAVSEEPSVVQEFTPERMKGLIAHELTHWIGDAVYNQKGQKALARYAKDMDSENDYSERSKITTRLRNASDEELNSFTAQIKQRRRSMGQEKWDNISFRELLQLDTALGHNFKQVYKGLGQSEYVDFVKVLIKRLHREGLLGKSMTRPFTSIDSMTTI